MKTIVRFSAVLLAVIMAVCAMALVSAAYTDVDSKTVHVDAIQTLSTLGILGGYEDGSFKPLDPVQRDEMAKMIYIMATTFHDAGEGEASFPDVSSKHWARGFISWCHGKSVVGGYEDGTFRPDDNITYDEALKMACAMLGYNDFDPAKWPTDMRTIAIKQLGLDYKIDEATTGDTAITRAQAAQILYNAFFKTMKTTQDVYDTIVDVNDETHKVPVDVAMTLAEDVWKCEVKSFQVIATENFAVKILTPRYGTQSIIEKTNAAGKKYKAWDDFLDTDVKDASTKTNSDTIIEVRDNDGNHLFLDVVDDLGLEDYKGNTDALMFLTYSVVYRDGEELGVPSINGHKTEKVPFGIVKTLNAGASNTINHNASNIYYTDRITVDGILHDGDVFENLRVATLQPQNGVYLIYDIMPGYYINDDSSKSSVYLTTDVRSSFFDYFPYNGYTATATGWDSNGDGFYDVISLEYPQVIEVTGISTNNGEKKIHYDTLHGKMYDGTGVDNGPYTLSYDSVISPRELKVGDVFVGYNVSDVSLQVMTIIDPVTAKATACDGKTLTLENVGRVSSLAYTFNGVGITTALNLTNYIEDYLTTDPATRSVPAYDYWIYKNQVVKCSATIEETVAEYDKAILLYVDEKPEVQIDKSTNQFVQFYPAYLLINGKEEAVNLNPLYAINDAPGSYVSADNSGYRATVNEDDQTLNFVYIPVTYKVDLDGYYSLYTTAGDLIDDNNTPDDVSDDVVLEKVIPASQNPKLAYNATTGLYTLTTDSETFNCTMVNEDTFLYYVYTKPSTGNYEYISFYTSDSIPTGEFEEIAFTSDVFLSYDEEQSFWVLKFGVLEGKFKAVEESALINYEEDGRAIYMAVEDSAKVAYEGQAHYEHTFYNFATGETFTAINKDKSIVGHANYTTKGYFYAWDETLEDYVEVFATGDDSTPTLNAYTIDAINENLSIIFTTDGEYTNGLKIADDFAIYAFDNEFNMQEVSFSDIVNLFDIYETDETLESASFRIVFVTYEDENGDMVNAYAFVDWAETITNDDGTATNEFHTDFIGNIWE